MAPTGFAIPLCAFLKFLSVVVHLCLVVKGAQVVGQLLQQSVSTQSSSGQLFEVVQYGAGGATLCALAQPSLSVAARSAPQCAAFCAQLYAPNCSHYNAKTSAVGVTCELFVNVPVCYGQVLGCMHYQVGLPTTIEVPDDVFGRRYVVVIKV